MKVLIIILTIIILQACEVKQRIDLNSFTVLRENYFDTSKFDLPLTDTNKFNPVILEKIFEKVELDHSSKLLLIETIFDVPMMEFKLYDFKTGKVYSLSTQDKEFTFKKVTDTSSISKIYFLRDKIDLLQQKAILQKQRLSHSPHYIVNFIEARKPTIVIKAIHLLDL